MPAVSLAAVPGKRQRALEMAAEIERRGFPGIYCPSLGDALGLCTSLAHVTTTIRFGTSIEPIYFRHPTSMAQTARYIHEVSGGRFDLGLGVSHGPVHERLGLEVGRPLVGHARLRRGDAGRGDRDRRAAADRAGDAARSDGRARRRGRRRRGVGQRVAQPHGREPRARSPRSGGRRGFFVGNMIPTVIDDDRDAAAAAINRARSPATWRFRTTATTGRPPATSRRWKPSSRRSPRGSATRCPALMSDRWLADCTLFGTATDVRDGVEAWFDAGRDDADPRHVIDEGRPVRRDRAAVRRLLVSVYSYALLVRAERRAGAHEVPVALRAVDASDRRPVLRPTQ